MEIPGWEGPGGLKEALSQLEETLKPKLPGDTEIVDAALKLYHQIFAWPVDVKRAIDAISPQVSGEIGDFQIEIGLQLQRQGRNK